MGQYYYPIKPIWFLIYSKFWTFKANSYYPREGKAENGKLEISLPEWKNEFQYLGHSNWTVCSLLSQFSSLSSSTAPSYCDRRPHLWQRIHLRVPEEQTRRHGATTKVQDCQDLSGEIIFGGAQYFGGRPRYNLPLFGGGLGNVEPLGNRRRLPEREETTCCVDGH